MNDQYTMFGLVTSEDTNNAISSQESGYGVTPSDALDGQIIAKSGPARVPANPSAPRGKAKRSTTKGIFGQSCFHSSKHDDLSFVLANRYRVLTASLGSTLFDLTWMTRITPAGFSIPAQRALAHLTDGSVCIGWRTPLAGDCAGQGMENKITENKLGVKALNDWVLLARWPTPTTGDYRSGMENRITGDKAGLHAVGLNDWVLLARWLTTRQTDGDKNVRTVEGATREMERKGGPHEAPLTAFGDQPIGYLLGRNGWEIVPAFGQLNPAFSRWLMGLPKEWDDCGVTAMESLRNKRKHSSKPT